MSDRGSSLNRVALIERTTTSIVRARQVVTAAAGVIAVSDGTAPPATTRWLIMHVSAGVEFDVNPAAGDRGSGIAELRFAAIRQELMGAEVDDTFGQAEVVRGTGTELLVDPGFTFLAVADARGSSVAVIAIAVMWGIQFADI